MNRTKLIALIPLIAILSLFACTTNDDSRNTTIPNYQTYPDGGGDVKTSVDASLSDATVDCDPETNTDFCARLGVQCGDVAQFDNCSAPRNVRCGDCVAGDVCNGGFCQTPSPDCVPESDVAFCSQYEKNCGSLTKTDNCGQTRTVANCGDCLAPSTCTKNVCTACVPKTCATIANSCGAQTDGCGNALDCGTCIAGSQCSAPANGTCIVCPAGKHACGNKCVLEDVAACGDTCEVCTPPVGGMSTCFQSGATTYGCLYACNIAGQENVDGTCMCTAPTPNLCAGVCTDLNLDASNCGACGNACAPKAGLMVRCTNDGHGAMCKYF